MAAATKTLEKDLLTLERKYWQAMKEKDGDAAMRLTDDTCIITGAQGVSRLDQRTLKGMLEDATWTIEKFDIGDDVQVSVIDDDVAILAYKVHEELTVEGKPVALDAADASTWVRRDGNWVCALHTESIAGDPFGRDRRPQ
jgi:hypothetical protein